MADKKRVRVSGSQTDEDTGFLITKSEVESIVTESVGAALQNFKEKFTELINTKIEATQKHIKALEVKTDEMADQQAANEFDFNNFRDTTEEEVRKLKTKNSDLESEIKSLKVQVKSSEAWANRTEQYSRRNHIRIQGIQPVKGEPCKTTVVKFINNKLNLKDSQGKRIQVEATDIDAAHPLPVRNNSRPHTIQSNQSQQVSPIIVRFHQRELRDKVIMSLRQLKGQKITIAEDLTSKNNQLLYKLRNCPAVENAWTWNGKVFAKVCGQTRIQNFDIHDALPTI